MEERDTVVQGDLVSNERQQPRAETVSHERESDGPKAKVSRVRTARTTLTWSEEPQTEQRRVAPDTIPDHLAPNANHGGRRTLPGLELRQSIIPTDAPPPSKAEPSVRPTSRTPRQGSKKLAKAGSRDTTRAYVRVDDVGTKAVQIARALRSMRAPRVIATRDMIRKAPLEQTAAFVLAFIDGATDEEALVDVTGLPSSTISDAIEALVRLGLVAFPA